MAIENVAILFDNRLRPETTGIYCLSALRQLVKVRHILPEDAGQLNSNDFDLFLYIDDGLRYPVPTDLHPSAYWAIDTHLDFAWSLQRAQHVDVTFTAQRDGAQKLRDAGVESTQWLPLACDPGVHHRHLTAKEFDLSFIGNLCEGERLRLVEVLQRRYPDMVVGQRYFDEMALTYSQSRIVFNRSVRDDINMRVFEALASGSLLITNDLSSNGQTELFRDGVHLATYRDDGELLDKVDYYLSHEELRERIAARGHDAVHARHTYRERMQRLLENLDKRRETSLVSLNRKHVVRGTSAVATSEPANELSPSGNRSASPCQASHRNAPSPTGDRQDSHYFEFARPELLALIPESARRVLEVGCGTGRLGESLKKRQRAQVTGIELNANAAIAARTRLDSVSVGNIEDPLLAFEQSEFDCIVCGDILEHLSCPADVLRRMRLWLGPQGHLIASIPNTRHHSVVGSLLNGNWTYERSGLLDATHRQFFTRLSIEHLFYRCGFEIQRMHVVPGAGYAEWQHTGRPGSVQVGWLCLSGLQPEDAEEFYVYQYLVDAVPAKICCYPLTSIVVVTHNCLSYTRACIESLRARTDEPFELILVDNGSTDGTVEYLNSLSGVTVIANRTNRGFPAAVNQGISVSQGGQVLLLNNDVIVTVGWLRRMLDALSTEPSIGIVGPVTNWPESPQSLSVSYGDDLLDLESFSFSRGIQFDGQQTDAGEIIGFCMLLRRDVIDKIGLFDEEFGIGQCEDKDFCARARRAGVRIVIAQDAYVHHFGHRTFLAAGINSSELLLTNLNRFRSRSDEEEHPLAGEQSSLDGKAVTAAAHKRSTPHFDRLIRVV